MHADAINPEAQRTTLIGWSKLLNRFANNPGFIEKLARTTLASQPKVVAQLRDKTLQRDLHGIAFAAHSLKSVAGYFEASQIFELAQRTEVSARKGQDDAFALAGELADGFAALLDELSQRFPPSEQGT